MATLTMTVTSFSATSWPPTSGMSLLGNSPPNEIAVVPYPPAGNNVFGTVAHGVTGAVVYVGTTQYNTLVSQVSSPQTMTVTITYTPATQPTPQYITAFTSNLS